MFTTLVCCIGSLAGQDAPLQIPDSVQQAEQARIDAIAKGSRCTIGVFGPQSQGGGSGVVISADGYALSNYCLLYTSPSPQDRQKARMPSSA